MNKHFLVQSSGYSHICIQFCQSGAFLRRIRMCGEMNVFLLKFIYLNFYQAIERSNLL
jgi:hypothetical protein